MDNARRLIGAVSVAAGLFFLGRAARSGVPTTSLAVGAALMGTGGLVIALDELHHDLGHQIDGLGQRVENVETRLTDALQLTAEMGLHMGGAKERHDTETLHHMEDQWATDDGDQTP